MQCLPALVILTLTAAASATKLHFKPSRSSHPNTIWSKQSVHSKSNSMDHGAYKASLKQGVLSRGHEMAEGRLVVPPHRECPCDNKSLCDIVQTRAKPGREIFIFSIHNDSWRGYDWDKITTISTFTYYDDQVMCFAHSKGIKVVHGANIPKQHLINSTARHLWVTQVINSMTFNFLDGMNVDFEENISANETAYRDGLTMLLKELNQAAKAVSPYTQITFDFTLSPDSTGRHYDYKAMADIIDFAFIMDYDELGGKYASANSNYDKTFKGMERFLAIGIPGDKLVLGAPWYGYRFRCAEYDQKSHQCTVEPHQFSQVMYRDILGLKAKYSITGELWDPVAKSPYFSLRDPIDQSIHQIWYDNPTSLKIKFNLIDSLGLRGAGNWEADDLDYDDPKQVKEMWGAFP